MIVKKLPNILSENSMYVESGFCFPEDDLSESSMDEKYYGNADYGIYFQR